MKTKTKVIIVGVVLLYLLASCTPCDKSMCEYKKGDQVKILNKTFHDNATVTDVMCGCNYEVSYFSTFGVRRHRVMTEGEIK
jgi:hypothetical protein